MMMTTYAIRGTTDDVTVCACCGKKNLASTVLLEVVEGDNAGDVLNFGSHCAARALGVRKSHSDVVLSQAKRRQEVDHVVAYIRANIHLGIEAIKQDARDFAKSIGIDALINGFDSWGQIDVHYKGIKVEIKK